MIEIDDDQETNLSGFYGEPYRNWWVLESPNQFVVIISRIPGQEHTVEATTSSLKITWTMEAPTVDAIMNFSDFTAEDIFKQICVRHVGTLEFSVKEGNLQIDQDKWKIIHEPSSKKAPVAYSYQRKAPLRKAEVPFNKKLLKDFVVFLSLCVFIGNSHTPLAVNFSAFI